MANTLGPQSAAETRDDVLPAVAPPLGQRIAQELSATAPRRVTRRSGGRVEELLLEEEVEGARYVVTRSYQEAPLALSAREQEIVRLVARGLPNKGIGAVLDISPWTVATHLRRIYAKLNVPSRAAMVAAAAEHGVIARGESGLGGPPPARSPGSSVA